MSLFADHSLSHTHSPTAAGLLHTPFFRSAKKKSYLVGTILDGLPPLTMRQERCRRSENLTTQRTTDSWDFGSTTISSLTSSLIPPSPRIAQKTKTLSTASECNHDDEAESHGRSSKDGSAEPRRQATMGPSATTSSLGSEALSLPHLTTPIPIARRDGVSGYRHSMLSSHFSASTTPDSTRSSSSSSFWDKLTRRPSRNALTDRESPKGNNISRFLGRRGSSSLVHRPTFTSS